MRARTTGRRPEGGPNLVDRLFGGGGDAVKHGDLDSTLKTPSRELDVHMSPDGADFSCQECHTTTNHDIQGNAMFAVVEDRNQQYRVTAGDRLLIDRNGDLVTDGLPFFRLRAEDDVGHLVADQRLVGGDGDDFDRDLVADGRFQDRPGLGIRRTALHRALAERAAELTNQLLAFTDHVLVWSARWDTCHGRPEVASTVRPPLVRTPVPPRGLAWHRPGRWP